MTIRQPLVLGADNLPQQLQVGDSLISFNQTRWTFTDFFGFAAPFTTSGSNLIWLPSTSGQLYFNTNGGNVGVKYVTSSSNAAQIEFAAGLFARFVFIAGSSSSILNIIGFHDSTSNASPSNGIYVQCPVNTTNTYTLYSNNGGSITTGASSSSIPTGTLLALDIEATSSSSARAVLFNLATNAKYLDTTFTTNLPVTNSFNACMLAYGSNSTQNLLTCDYMGFGLGRPSGLVTPS